MFGNLSVQTKLYGGFGIVVAILLVLLLTTYGNFVRLNDANNWDRHTLKVLQDVAGAEADITDVQSEYRGFLLTGNERVITGMEANQESLLRHLQNMKTLTAHNAGQQEKGAQIEAQVRRWINDIARPLVAKRRELGKTANAADLIARDPLVTEGYTRVGEIRRLLAAYADEERKLLEERSRAAVEQRQTVLMLLIGGGLACILAAVAIAVMLGRSILGPLGNLTGAVNRIAVGEQSARVKVVGRDEFAQVAVEFNRMAQNIQDAQRREQESTEELRRRVDELLTVVVKAEAGDLTGKIAVGGTDAIGRLGNGLATMFDKLRALLDRVQRAGIQVATSTTEIAASARQQEATGMEHAQTSIEVLSTTKEISANTAQLLKAMEEVNHVAEDTAAVSADAQGNIKRMDQTMQRMAAATDSINAKLAALSEKASNINNVLTTITKVADQTNILSLNAAIEAEKAGEAGRGFSVVATEIRRLADQTSISTWDIEQMLKEMQSAVSASVMGMDKFSEEIRRSVDETRNVGDSLANVIDQVQKLTPRFDLVFEGMQSQATGAQQITETMTQLNEATQQAVDALKSTGDAVKQLQYAAHDLQEGVSRFAVAA